MKQVVYSGMLFAISLYVTSFLMYAMPRGAWYGFATVVLLVLGAMGALLWFIHSVTGYLADSVG